MLLAAGLQTFFARVFDGLLLGSIYAVVAIALVLIFKATTLINFAQGELAALGGFTAYWFWSWGLPIGFALVIAMLILGFVGAGIERVFIRPFDPSDHLPVVLITLGLSYIILSFNQMTFGNQPEAGYWLFPFDPAGKDYTFTIGGARVAYATVGIILTMFAMVGVTYLILNRTKVGLAFRAVSSNTESARLVGIRTGRTLQFGWALAAAFGTLGAALVVGKLNLEPNFMATLLIFSFAAAALGGLDSIGGAVIGGLIIGQIGSVGIGYGQEIPGLGWIQPLSLAVAFLVILVILLFKPTGLFGTRQIARV